MLANTAAVARPPVFLALLAAVVVGSAHVKRTLEEPLAAGLSMHSEAPLWELKGVLMVQALQSALQTLNVPELPELSQVTL